MSPASGLRALRRRGSRQRRTADERSATNAITRCAGAPVVSPPFPRNPGRKTEPRCPQCRPARQAGDARSRSRTVSATVETSGTTASGLLAEVLAELLIDGEYFGEYL